MYIVKYLYGASEKDGDFARRYAWRVGIDCDRESVTEYIDELGSRSEFEKLLDIVKRGDIVIISSVAALYDGNDFSIIRKIRRLAGHGVKLLVEQENNFSYAAYENWYRQKQKIEEDKRLWMPK